MRHYFTFGQDHTHRVNNVTLDKDSVVEIVADNQASARCKMFDTFDAKWAMQYTEDTLDMRYFPRGVVLTLRA